MPASIQHTFLDNHLLPLSRVECDAVGNSSWLRLAGWTLDGSCAMTMTKKRDVPCGGFCARLLLHRDGAGAGGASWLRAGPAMLRNAAQGVCYRGLCCV